MWTSSLHVAYLGPPASFSHQAAHNFFAQLQSRFLNPKGTPPVGLIPHPSFASVFAAVQTSSTDSPVYGIVPFENSSNGSVVQLLDLLADREGRYSDVRVCAEYYLRVRHCLLGRKQPLGSAGGQEKDKEDALKRVEKLYTHPQAWSQCSAFLERHFKGVEKYDVSSTSGAAEKVAQEEATTLDGHGRSAAIASQLAAEVYGLDVLKEGIEDQGDNVTRFFVLRREFNNGQERHIAEVNEVDVVDTATPKKWKSLISFTIDHGAPGALADALGIFRKHAFNLTSIDTRPSRVRPWHYIFFVECEQAKRVSDAADRAGVDGIMSDLELRAHSCRHLGRWRDELDQTETEND
jgi:prephenate dehydratase